MRGRRCGLQGCADLARAMPPGFAILIPAVRIALASQARLFASFTAAAGEAVAEAAAGP